jgi:hypothetical protein
LAFTLSYTKYCRDSFQLFPAAKLFAQWFLGVLHASKPRYFVHVERKLIFPATCFPIIIIRVIVWSICIETNSTFLMSMVISFSENVLFSFASSAFTIEADNQSLFFVEPEEE